MRRCCVFAALFALMSLLGLPRARGETLPEDRYVVIYNLVQEAETLSEAGSSPGTLAKYQEAHTALQKFQGEFPDWNPRVVSFRLDYLASKITLLAGQTATTRSPATAAPVAVRKPAAPPPAAGTVVAPKLAPSPQPPTLGDIAEQLKILQAQVQQAQADNAQLETKLKESAPAPAPDVDTTQAAKAEERIDALQKQNEQLKAELEQQQARAAQRIEPALLEQTQRSLEDANRKLAQQQETASTLTLEKETLQKQVEGLSAGGTASAKTAAELEQTKRALDEAQRKLNQQTEAATALAKEKESLQRSLDDLTVKAKAADEVEQVKQSLTDASRKLAQQNEAASALTREKEALQKQVESLTAGSASGAQTTAELERTKRALDEALRKLVQETGAAAAVAKEKETLQKRVDSLSAKTQAPAESAETRQALDEAGRKLAQQNEAVAALTQEREALQEQVKELAAKASANAKAAADLEQAKRALEEGQRKLDQQTEAAAVLAREKEALRKSVADLTVQAKATAEWEQTRQRLEEADRKLAQQNEITSTLTREKEALQKQVDFLSASDAARVKVAAELEQTRRTLDAAERQLAQRTEAAAALAREKEALQESVADLAVKAKAADELEQTKQALDEVRRKLNQQVEASALLLADANRKLEEQYKAAAAWAQEKESLQERLSALTIEATKATAVAGGLEGLQERARRAEANQALLEAKLKEALAARPAAIDPRELAKADEEIRKLQTENELLKTSLAQQQAKTGPPADGAAVAQTKQALADLRRKLEAQAEAATLLLVEANSKLEQQNGIVTALTQERDALQKRLEPLAANADAVAALRAENEVLQKQLVQSKSKATPPPEAKDTSPQSPEVQAQLAALQSERDMLRLEKIALEQRLKQKTAPAAPAAAGPSPDTAEQAQKIRRLERERDELQKQLAAISKRSTARAATTAPAQIQALSNQVNALQAKLGVLEAKPVPYTTEELALFTKPEPKLQAADPGSTKKSLRNLPLGGVTLMADAQRYFVARQFNKAEEKYLELLRQDNQSVYILANLAAIQLELGRLDEAGKNAEQALALDPGDAFSLGILGALKFRQGKHGEALEVLSRAAQLNPQNAQVQNYLGITLSHKGQRVPAETALRKAIQLDPGYASAHNNLAVVYATQQPPMVELARWHYQKALAIGHPRNPDLEKLLDANKPAESPR